LEKEKEFAIPIWQSAETQLEAELGPANRSFPSPFLHSRVAQSNQPILPGISSTRSPRAA
jgi:hypothetical protein